MRKLYVFKPHCIYLKSFRSCILFCLPFFIVELFGFIHFFLSSGIKNCCSLIASKSVGKLLIKYDLLFFVGNKDKSGKSKLLSLESAKIFFGSGERRSRKHVVGVIYM